MSRHKGRNREQQLADLRRNGLDIKQAYRAFNRGDRHYVRAFLNHTTVDSEPLQRIVNDLLRERDPA